MQSRKGFWLLVIVASCVTVWQAYQCWRTPVDFPQYWTAGKLYVTGDVLDLYDFQKLSALQHEAFPAMPIRHQLVTEFPDPAAFRYPPYTIPLLAWLAIFPPAAAMVIWTVSSLVALGAALHLLDRVFKISAVNLAALWAVIGISGPYAQAIILGQPIFFMVFALTLVIVGFREKRLWLQGIGLVLLVAKPTLALPILAYAFGAKRFKPLFVVAAAGLILLALTVTTMPRETWHDYIQMMTTHKESAGLYSHLTVSGALWRISPESSSVRSLILNAVYGVDLLAIVFMGYRFARSPRWLEAGLLAALPLGLIATPYLHPYDLLILIPTVLVWWNGRQDGLQPLFSKERLVVVISFVLLFGFLIYASIYFWKFPINLHFVWVVAFVSLLVSEVMRNRTGSYFAES